MEEVSSRTYVKILRCGVHKIGGKKKPVKNNGSFHTYNTGRPKCSLQEGEIACPEKQKQKI